MIGAGSAFFGLQTVHGMVTREPLLSGTLALVDTDVKKLEWVAHVARRAIVASKAPLDLVVETDRRKALKGADFVILAFASESVKLRGLDAEISTKHGMPLCSADTVGPGGIMRTLREVPRQAAILKDVERLCPDAWVANWVNPTAAMGIAMTRRFPRLRSFALCDLPHNPMFDNNLIVAAGLAPSSGAVTDALRARVRIRSGGVNHFNWLVAMEYNGSDVTGAVKLSVKRDAETADMNTGAPSVLARWRLTEAIGYVPMCIRHTKEYLPFFQGHDMQWRTDESSGNGALRLDAWDSGRRMRWMRERWADMRELASGHRSIEDFLGRVLPDHMIDIVEAMWTGSRQHFYINVHNGGAVTNMSADAYLELPCTVDMNEIRPLPFGPMPRPLLGYMYRVLDEHELAVDAAVSCDKAKLRQAFLASMLAVSIPDVDTCIKQMLRRQKQHLPDGWR